MKYFTFFKVFLIVHTAGYRITVQENKTFVPPLILLLAQWWGKQQW